jgi:hypothetical protein
LEKQHDVLKRSLILLAVMKGRFKISIVDEHIDCMLQGYAHFYQSSIENPFNVRTMSCTSTERHFNRQLWKTTRCERRRTHTIQWVQWSRVSCLKQRFFILYYSVCFDYLLTFSIKDGSDLQCSHTPLKIFEKNVLHLIDKAWLDVRTDAWTRNKKTIKNKMMKMKLSHSLVILASILREGHLQSATI